MIEAARECRYYAVDCLNLGAGGDQEVDQERILGVVDRAVFGEEPATAAERAGEGRSPRQILCELRDVLRPAVARCAARYGKGEQQTSHATSAIKEFRLLSSTIRQLNATTRDDTDLDLLLSQTPGRLAEIDALATVGFVPPLEPDRSVPDLS